MTIERKRSGFTLVELLIVIAIIGVLAGLLIAVVTSLKRRAKDFDTSQRLQAILDALSVYGDVEGSVVLTFQERLGLGGASHFASFKVIGDMVKGTGGSPPPPFVYEDGTNTPMAESVAQNGSAMFRKLKRYTDAVFDVRPDAPFSSITASWYQDTWPLRWPVSTWEADDDAASPILPFPWGRPGLRLDGSPCDPGAPESDSMVVREQTVVQTPGQNAFTVTVTPVDVENRWVSFGGVTAGPYEWTAMDPAQTSPVRLLAATRSDGSAVPADRVMANLPIPYDLGHSSPLRTIQFLQAAGILEPGVAGVDAYRKDRSPRRPWNDAWGNPLVVVYTLYQPERYFRRTYGQNRRDLLLRSAKKAYGMDRAAYISAGSAGGNLRTPLPVAWTSATEDCEALRSLWLQIRDVCDAEEWDETGFEQAPWTGVRSATVGSQHCLLAAPVVVR